MRPGSRRPPRAILGEGLRGGRGLRETLLPNPSASTTTLTGMDEHGNHNGSHGTNVRPVGRWAKVLNESWPQPDIARQLREYDADKQIPVTARLVFETGEEQLPGVAVWWVRRPTEHVRVRIDDNRLQSGGVWLVPGDVKRR